MYTSNDLHDYIRLCWINDRDVLYPQHKQHDDPLTLQDSLHATQAQQLPEDIEHEGGNPTFLLLSEMFDWLII